MTKQLEALWKSSRFRLYHPQHLGTFFRLHHRFDLQFVRLSQLHVEIPRGTLPDCESCTNICCTGPNAVVSLRLTDIARLIDVGLENHITFRRPLPLHNVSWAAQEARWSVFSESFPILKRDKTGTCSLLSENRTCNAYPDWPLSCARYPYALDVLRKRMFLAQGCRSHRFVSIDDAPGKVKELVEATIRGYNERVKDIILLHVALPELLELGFGPYLRLRGKLLKQAERWQKRSASGAADSPPSTEISP